MQSAAMIRRGASRAFTQASSASCGIHTSAARRQIYESITDTIGRTPVVKANRLLSKEAQNKGIQLYLKLEYFNPLFSVKDRLALAVILAGEKSGELKPGMTVVEATSGNTGIALAMVCASRGYPFVAVMAEPYSIERRKIMRALGAKVVITPKSGSGTGMLAKVDELAAKHGWFKTKQFSNPANDAYHASTTGPEILRDFAGRKLDYWVTGYGTGGTFTGAGKMLKLARPDIKIILAEPEEAPLIKSGVKQEQESNGTPVAHPKFTAHAIQGWTPNFIAGVAQRGVDAAVQDEVILVSGAEAISTAKRMTAQEGIFTGISGGGSTFVALKVAEKAPKDSVILAMVPDTQERYQSTPLYDDIKADMNEEEMAISKSTPSFQLA